jgi:hypothetical protein
MEISPIAGIRAMPVVKSPPAEPELTAVFDIDNSARIGDETWTPSDSKQGRGSEDDGSDDEFVEFDDPADLEAEGEPAVFRVEGSKSRQISFFA